MIDDLAISVHAPMAWALMYGGKDVENRGKSFPRQRDKRQVLGRVWVHASMWPSPKGIPKAGLERAEWECAVEKVHCLATDHLGGSLSDTLLRWKLNSLRGHIVGSIYVEGYREPDDPPNSPWYIPGSLAILVRDPKPLAKPVPAKGALGWWTVPPAVVEETING